MVRVGEHLLEGELCLLDPAGARERLDVPERADRERALVATQAVRRGADVVAVDERVGHELLRDRVERRQPARVGRGDELDERHEQHRRVEELGVVVLDERLALLVPAPRHDLAVDRVARLEPANEVGGETAEAGDPDRPLDRDP